MTRVTNVDQILVLLRAHLERLERQKRAVAHASRRSGVGQQTAMDRVRELAAAETVTEGDLGRALIAALLSQELGASLSTEIPFQALVERVNQSLTEDPDAAALLQRALTQLARTD